MIGLRGSAMGLVTDTLTLLEKYLGALWASTVALRKIGVVVVADTDKQNIWVGSSFALYKNGKQHSNNLIW